MKDTDDFNCGVRPGVRVHLAIALPYLTNSVGLCVCYHQGRGGGPGVKVRVMNVLQNN